MTERSAKQRMEADLRWEQFIHEEFFLPFYEKKGIKVIEDHIKNGTKHPFDVVIEHEGSTWRVDQKAIRANWDKMNIEILQDIHSRSAGWVYSEKDLLLWANFGSEEEAREGKDPKRLCWVKAKELLDVVCQWGVKDGFGMRPFDMSLDIHHSGSGRFALNVNVDWRWLEERGVAKPITL